MKVVILAGGFGTRISEESIFRPKPLIDIGGMPIIIHIMKYYYAFGYDDFIICGGYKQENLKEYFSNYKLHASDVCFDMKTGNAEILENHAEPWKVTVVDTGYNTMTGGRLKRVMKYIGDEPFMLTYGDGVSDVDLNAMRKFHEQNGHIATITAVMPGGRFGALRFDGDCVSEFKEKRREDGGWINGGFMMFEPEIADYIEGDSEPLEAQPFARLVAKKQLDAYKHPGFWQCMDSMKDKEYVEELIATGKAPWMIW